MAYRRPDVTFKEFRKTLSQGYGVTFNRKTIPLGTKGSFTAVHCSRVLGRKTFETMYKSGQDNEKIGWDTIDAVCRVLNINYSEDGLWSDGMAPPTKF